MRAFKTELDPNNVQATLLAKSSGVARFAYNWGLSRRIDEYKKTKKSSNAIDQHKQLNALKNSDFPWMYDVSKCAPQEALRDLDKAYAGFFRRVKAGEKPGFPRFKSKHKSKPSFRLSSPCSVFDGKIRLPKIGWVRLKEKDYLPTANDATARQLSVTVKGTGSGRWFVSVQCEVDGPESKQPDHVLDAIGIDVGLKSFAVISDGTKVDPPKALRNIQKRLRRLQRGVSRKVKGGINRKKSVRKVNSVHFKVACQRKDFIHKLTSMLVKTKPAKMYVLEDLNIRGMVKNHKLAFSISDAGWGEFARQLEYKAIANGSKVVYADRFFPSSKTCSACADVKSDLKLSDRIYLCGSCGLSIDRDLNAAINLSKLPLVQREVTPAESMACKATRGSRKKTVSIPNGIDV